MDCEFWIFRSLPINKSLTWLKGRLVCIGVEMRNEKRFFFFSASAIKLTEKMSFRWQFKRKFPFMCFRLVLWLWVCVFLEWFSKRIYQLNIQTAEFSHREFQFCFQQQQWLVNYCLLCHYCNFYKYLCIFQLF